MKLKLSGNAIVRACFVAVSLAVQVGWILLTVLKLHEYYAWISLGSSILAAVIVLKLHSKQTNVDMKLPWIMLIMAFPVLGLCMYLLFELLGDPGVGRRMKEAERRIREQLPAQIGASEKLETLDPDAAGQFRYLQSTVGAPVYENTAVTYYPEATDAFEAMKAELEKAERFIFMEYFIVEDASSFREIQEILIRKKEQGVQVRLLYDDIGSVGYVNLHFAARMNRDGIRCVPFNPAVPVLNLFMNHRDHRKITVIDGKVGFTGGFNLADAYFDRERPFGKWKDTGLKLEGEAVTSLTALFLQMWHISARETEDWGQYLNTVHSVTASGFVQPFGDDPLGTERAAQNVYMNMIEKAKHSVYFMTPYLIIPDEMTSALGRAAKRGVNVRIITPGIPDKKTVYAVTRSYYGDLAAQGVRLYEYTPGFCHGKMCVSDGKMAAVGTSNLDYRSLYHHFENNVLLCGCEAVEKIERDFLDLFPQCREVTEDYRTGGSTALKMWQCALRLFAPLM